MIRGQGQDPKAGAGTRDALLGHVIRHLPELQARQLDFLGEGDFCRAYLLDGRYVVRFPRHHEASAALRREACLMPLLAPQLSLSVPVPTFHADPGKEAPLPITSGSDGPSFSLHERVMGEALSSAAWRTLPHPIRARLAGELGRFFRELHRVDVNFGRSCSLRVQDGRARARKLLTGISRETTGIPFPSELRDSLATCLEGYLGGGPLWAFEPAILHADISPGHVLLDDRAERITGIIDWGDAVIGDPARDFIFLYEDWDGDFLTRALQVYDPEKWATLLPRVYLQYLIDQLDWTLNAAAGRREPDVGHGVDQLALGVRDLLASSNPSH